MVILPSQQAFPHIPYFKRPLIFTLLKTFLLMSASELPLSYKNQILLRLGGGTIQFKLTP